MVHPILRDKERFGPYLVAALLIGLLMAFALAGTDRALWKVTLFLTLPLVLFYSFVCLAAWHPCRANPLSGSGALRILGTHVAAALLSSGLWLLAGTGWSALVGGLFPEAPEKFIEWTPLWFATGVLLYLLAAALHYLLIAFEASRQAEARTLELKLLAREAELEAFKTQIDPHFIFNCLNSISSLCGSDPAAARSSAIRLGDLLRASLRMSANDLIPLSEELRLAAAYLDVERMRYGKRLSYQEDVPPECLACEVPALLLQPLLENALKHGIAHLLEGGRVTVEGELTDDRMRLVVINAVDPDYRGGKSTGIGLANVRGRLELLYDGKATFEASNLKQRFRVEIGLPLSRAGKAGPARAEAGS